MTRTRALLALGLLVALIAVVVIWACSYQPMVRKWSLSNGAEIELIRITAGKNHRAIDGGWRDMVYPFVPEGLRKKWNWQVGKYGPTTNYALVVWVRVVNPGTNTNRRGPQLQLGIAAMDENGLESPRDFFLLNTSNIPRPLELKNFPRRSSELTVRVYDAVTQGGFGFFASVDLREPESRIGEFRIPNPSPSKAPPWVAEKLPAQRSNNDLTISLLSLETGFAELMDNTKARGSNASGGRFSRAVFDVRENGQRSSNWWVASISASTAAGEVLRTRSIGGTWEEEGYVFHFEGVCWVDEPAWKLTANVWRAGISQVQDLWTVKGIRAPKSNEVVEVHAKTNLCGAEVEVVSLGGPNSKPPLGWIDDVNFPISSKLSVLMQDPAGDVQLSVVGARDDYGRTLDSRHAGTSGNIYSFRVVKPADAETFDITLAASRHRTVEFIVKPELAK